MITIPVRSPDGPSSVFIGPGQLARLGEHVRAAAPHAVAFLALDAALPRAHSAEAIAALEAAGYRVHAHPIIAEESRKTLETVRGLYEAMLAARLERTSPVVALGGGLTGDVAGFAAATYQRGLPLVHAPTTLLAMVDAAIGGKTGVNLPMPGGPGALLKNLIGAFWPPRAVVIDPLVLRTLPGRELRGGLAECIKHGIIADPGLFELIERSAERAAALEMETLVELIERAARVKIAIVERDAREMSERARLNLGHTFGHAIESFTDLQLRHGEAVAIGLCAAAEAARLTGRLPGAAAARIRSVITRCGLPARLPRPISTGKLIAMMSRDKKVREGRLRLILPSAIGAVAIVDDGPRELLESAWRAVGADAD